MAICVCYVCVRVFCQSLAQQSHRRGPRWWGKAARAATRRCVPRTALGIGAPEDHSESAQGSTVLVWGCLKIWGPPKCENMASPKMVGFFGFPLFLNPTGTFTKRQPHLCHGQRPVPLLGVTGMALKSPGKDP